MFCSAGEECKMAAGEGGRWKCPQPLRCQRPGTLHRSEGQWVQALNYMVLPPFPKILQKRVRGQIWQIISSGTAFVLNVSEQIRLQAYLPNK